MDVYTNVAVSGGKVAAGAGCQPERAPSTAEFLPGENEGGDDMSLEWLSMFMEDCLSATPSYIPTPQPYPTPTVKSSTTTTTTTTTTININNTVQASAISSNSMPKKRKMTQIPHNYLQAYHVIPSDPPLLHQTHWLADSELIFPKKSQESKEAPPPAAAAALAGEEEMEAVEKEGSQQQPRRCTHCLSQKTPQWRTGPQGPKTLCNACGVRFKSGRLFPEYRPAKSPSFVSYKHSNSHKKIMEMRMALMSSPSK